MSTFNRSPPERFKIKGSDQRPKKGLFVETYLYMIWKITESLKSQAILHFTPLNANLKPALWNFNFKCRQMYKTSYVEKKKQCVKIVFPTRRAIFCSIFNQAEMKWIWRHFYFIEAKMRLMRVTATLYCNRRWETNLMSQIRMFTYRNKIQLQFEVRGAFYM